MPSYNNHTGRGGGRSNTKPNKRPPQTREVTISKQLGYLLRHGAKDEGIGMDDAGFVDVDDVVSWEVVHFMHACVEQ